MVVGTCGRQRLTYRVVDQEAGSEEGTGVGYNCQRHTPLLPGRPHFLKTP